MFYKSSYFKGVFSQVSNSKTLVNHSSKKYSKYIAVVGAQLGDEGKGRIIDNKISELAKQTKDFYVIRSQGGSNAGHTVQIGDVKIGLHQIPSAVFHKNAKMILDFGMVLHPDDLLAEIELVESLDIDLTGRLFVSEDAMLCTDIERAKEVLNRVINGNAKGGTGRGMSPTTGQRLEKLGFEIKDLLREDWKEIFTKHYIQFEKMFKAFGEDLASYDVPDFKQSKLQKESISKKLGSLDVYLDRLASARKQIIEKGIVTDTYKINQEAYINKTPVFFEMAQAIGLSPAFGTRPDTTSTETSIYGISLGTRVFPVSEIEERIGVMKATYMSSVGERQMPTEVDNDWAKWVRDFANEYGTTTRRPRDICYLDLPFLLYNNNIGGINQLAMTHLDVARENEKIKVCIGYEKDGQEVYYKPDLEYLNKVKPIYIELDGWSSEECQKAKSFDDLPANAKLFVNFVESSAGIPVTIITTGPERDNVIRR